MSPDEAKAKSHEYLREHSIQITETLPLLESESELSPQGATSVARRSIILSYVIGIGFGADVPKLQQYLEEIGLLQYASNKERRLLGSATHTEQEKIDATWLTECVQSLAWCLGLTELDPFRQCDDSLASNFPQPFVDPSDFIASAKLRPFNEIYQQADLHYRLHWAARNARLNGTKCKVEEGFIGERRKPLDWVIGVEGDWDEVPLDT